MYREMLCSGNMGIASGTLSTTTKQQKVTINTGLSTINGFVLYLNVNNEATRYSSIVYIKEQNSTKYLSTLAAGTTCQGVGFVTWNNNNTNYYSFTITHAPSGGSIEVMAPNHQVNCISSGYWYAW